MNWRLGCEPGPGPGARASLSCPRADGAAPVPSLPHWLMAPCGPALSQCPLGHQAGSGVMPGPCLLPTGSRAEKREGSQRRGSSHAKTRDRFPRRKGRSINCRAQLCARTEALLQFSAIFHALRNSSSSRGAQKVKAPLPQQRFHAHPAEREAAGAGHGPKLWSSIPGNASWQVPGSPSKHRCHNTRQELQQRNCST